MKAFLVYIIVTIMAVAVPIHKDKMMHAGVGMAIYGGCVIAGVLFEKITGEDIYLNEATCLIPVIMAGAGKEIYDKRYPENHTADFADFVATVAAPMAGGVILYKINF